MTATASDCFSRALGDARGSARTDFDDHLKKLTSVDLAEHKGVFADGWTDDWRCDHKLYSLADRLGYTLVFLWEHYDGDFSGCSEIAVVCPDGSLRSAPSQLHALLLADEDDDIETVVDAGSVGAVLATPGAWNYQGEAHAVYRY